MLDARVVALAFGFRQPDGDHLRAVIPLVDGGRKHRGPRSIAAGSAGARASPPAPWRSRSCRRRPRLRRTAAGPCAARDRAPSPASGRRCNRPWPAGRGWHRWSWEAVLWSWPGTLSYRAGVLHVGIEGLPGQPGIAVMTKPVQIEKEALRMPTIDRGRAHRPCASEGRRSAAGARFLLRRAGFYAHHQPARRGLHLGRRLSPPSGLNTWESLGGSPPPPGTTGLYHTAILVPDPAAVGRRAAPADRRQDPARRRQRPRRRPRRSICATRTTTASSSIGTGRRRSGRRSRTAACRCTPIRSTCMICWPSWMPANKSLDAISAPAALKRRRHAAATVSST